MQAEIARPEEGTFEFIYGAELLLANYFDIFAAITQVLSKLLSSQ